MNEKLIRDELCECAKYLFDRHLIGATEGNLTARLADGYILSTPTGVDKATLEPDDLVVLDSAGNPQGAGEPSSEILLHMAVYRLRPECGAVVHAHPITATGFACAGVPIETDQIPEGAQVLGPVATAPFALPGTDAVPHSIEPLLAGHKTILLSHHGAMTLGSDLWDATFRMETLERIAQVSLVAKQLGGIQAIPMEGVRVLRARYINGILG